MEKFLFFIPVLKNPEVLKEAANAIMYKRNVDIIILLNGADEDVKELVYGTYSLYAQFMIWENKENVYVTEAWNSAILFFKNHHEWDRLIIMNSDLTMQWDFDRILRLVWEENPEYIIVPNVINDKTKMFEHIPVEYPSNLTSLENPAGIFITLNHTQSELIYPIPSEIRIWYNDSYTYQLLRAAGYSIMMPDNLLAFHHTSMTIKDSSWAYEIIEQDKIAWLNVVEPMLQEKIKQLKNGQNNKISRN